eukprot:c28640_g1_i4 orf=667-1743(+)
MKKLRNGHLWEFEAEILGRKEDKRVLLGVDGGTTSTVCVCITMPSSYPLTDPPPVLARAVAGCSNHNSVGEEAAKDAIEHVLAETLMKAHCCRSAVQAACLAVSGVSHPSDRQRILQWLREIFPSDVELFVRNDSAAALACGTLGRLHGCVLIAGTGTIAYGFTEDGSEAWAAGAGPVLGDQGSGYAIAQQALTAVMRARDGRGPSTTLTTAILDRLQLSSPDEIIGWAYADSSWARIAALVPTVKACAAAGDTLARKILTSAVEELVCSIKAVVKRLTLAGEDEMKPFPLVMVGGVLETDDGWDLGKQLIQYIYKLFPGVHPIQPKVEPAVGAAMLAWTLYFKASGRHADCNGKLRT